jgi:hypothetical protein
MRQWKRPDPFLVLAVIVGVGFLVTALSQERLRRAEARDPPMAATSRLAAQAEP